MGIAESRGQEPAVLVREGGARVRDLAPGLVGVPGLESVLDTPVPAAIKPAAAPAQLSLPRFCAASSSGRRMVARRLRLATLPVTLRGVRSRDSSGTWA